KRAALKAGWRLKLTDDQKLILGQYQGLGYETVNGSLRGTARIPLSEEQLVRHTDALDSAIDAFPLPENIIVYRATSQFSRANVGDVITDMGYVSTTINPDVLSQHLHRSPGRQMVEIRLPAGTKGAYLDALNPISEFEVLLARGSQF